MASSKRSCDPKVGQIDLDGFWWFDFLLITSASDGVRWVLVVVGGSGWKMYKQGSNLMG